jgi:hypothetical protein
VKVDVKLAWAGGGGRSRRHLTGLLWSIVALLPGSYPCIYVFCVRLEDTWKTLPITPSLDLTYS